MRNRDKHIQFRSDEELMAALIDHDDQRALSELYQRYAQRLLGYFIKMFRGDVQKSQDFLQDLFVKILERKDQFDTNRKFYTWVFTIAGNMCKTEFRHQPDSSLNEEHEQKLWVYNDQGIDQRKMNEMLRHGIHNLEHHHKVTFLLRYVEGFSLKEVAEITETGIGTVKSRLFYATKKLAEHLKAFKQEIN